MKTWKNVLIVAWLVSGLLPSAGLCSSNAGVAGDSQDNRLYTRRFALLVGANNGGATRAVLRYAVADARAVGQVLEDMGGILPGDSRYLEDPDRATFLKAIRALAADVDLAQKTFRRVEVIFYYSGHSDEEALFLGDERVTYVELKDLITSLAADVRIAIFDSCASGALTLPKGVIKKAPFLLDTAYDMRGYAFMTSSSASEAAQESNRLGRSFFTHNLVSGMRGAADMNLDGRVTLTEAYQFAFDGTLTQTERTMGGAQHPSRHIQMSGTGDVVITELRRSAAVLVLESEFSGRIFIHNGGGVLLVELAKEAGHEVSIGLEAGDYRLFAVDGTGAYERKISLAEGKAVAVGRSGFVKAVRIPATVRGGSSPPPSGVTSRPGWRIEVMGGLAAINPADLNMRGTYDRMVGTFYGNDYLTYSLSQGEIASFAKTSEPGDFRRLACSAPFGIRLRRSLSRWLDVSVGITRFSGARNSSYADVYTVTELDGSTSVYEDRADGYIVAVKGYWPTLGIHVGGNLTPSLRLEANLAGGPLFGACRYSLHFVSNLPGPGGDSETPQAGTLEEKGRGAGPAFSVGAGLSYQLTRRYGLFLESGYAFQKISHLSGPGTRSITGYRDSWEGDWGMKQMVANEPWGTGRFLWPSNGWELFNGNWSRARDFKLDLSGFQAKVGVFFRF
jgi:hypothetical protein